MSEAQTNATPIVLDPMRVAFAPDATVLQLGRTHFIGIGGAGMSVLAEMLHERGVDVDGSDREEGSKTERLRSLGITVEIGQQADNVRGADTVVYSSAIKPDNPEIVAAHERGIRIVHRSDILALLMNGRRAVTSSSMPEPGSWPIPATPSAAPSRHPGERYWMAGMPDAATCWSRRRTNPTAAAASTVPRSR